ncbi:LysR family transcriptional regulator substrate-binding protein [Vibrio sp. WXL210]|uniref:LysR family transcriptional regulator substrate-binding protein n=1 Tax=Vibrio sp. WXL210 TaxID=3450709 RepID=UPI003EC60D0F
MPLLQQALNEVLVNPLMFKPEDWEGDVSISAPIEVLEVISLPLSQVIADVAPKVRPMFRPITSDYLSDLISGKVNMVFTYDEQIKPNNDVYFERIATLQPMIICRREHPLSELPSIHWHDLNPFPVVAVKSFDYDSQYLRQLFLKHSLASEVQGLYHSISIAQQMVANSDAYTFVFGSFTHLHPQVVTLPVIPPEGVSVDLCIVLPRYVRANVNTAPILERIKNSLAQHINGTIEQNK